MNVPVTLQEYRSNLLLQNNRSLKRSIYTYVQSRGGK